MTPKEKASELAEMFVPVVMLKMGQEDVAERAKRCAIIAVNEILAVTKIADSYISELGEYTDYAEYWQAVKTEIENL